MITKNELNSIIGFDYKLKTHKLIDGYIEIIHIIIGDISNDEYKFQSSRILNKLKSYNSFIAFRMERSK